MTALKLTIPVATLVIWLLASVAINAHYFPGPIDVFSTLINDIPSGELITDVLSSAKRLFLGCSLGIIVAIVLGIVFGLFDKARVMLMPTLNALRAMPVIALFPLIIMIFGITEATSIFIVAFVAAIPTLILTIDGVQQTRSEYSSLINNTTLSNSALIRHVLLPGAMPNILSGLDLSINQAFKVLILAELMGVNSGLGFRISEASEFLNYPKVYYLLIVIGFFALALNIAHSRFARRMLRWM